MRCHSSQGPGLRRRDRREIKTGPKVSVHKSLAFKSGRLANAAKVILFIFHIRFKVFQSSISKNIYKTYDSYGRGSNGGFWRAKPLHSSALVCGSYFFYIDRLTYRCTHTWGNSPAPHSPEMPPGTRTTYSPPKPARRRPGCTRGGQCNWSLSTDSALEAPLGSGSTPWGRSRAR